MNFQLHPTLAADSFVIGQFALCRLLLINDRQYPWFVLVPQRSDIEEIYQLSDSDQKQLWDESSQLSVAIMTIYNGDKLNIAAIGNLVPQLHIHHVVRFKDDPCWPKPIWGQLPMQHYDQGKIEEIKQDIVQKLADSGLRFE